MSRAKKDQTMDETTTDATPEMAALLAENAQLRAERTATAAQQDQILDLLSEMQARLDAVAANTATIAPSLVQSDAIEAELASELQQLKQEFKDYPAIDVLERRVLVGAEANNEIRLIDEASVVDDPDGRQRRWMLRWFNLAKEGRAAQADAEAYVKVRWSELRSEESLGLLERKDEYVRRGERGSEVLYKIPLPLYLHKKKRDARRTQSLLASESQLRDHLSNGVAGMAEGSGGNADQAGSTFHRDFSLSITPGQRERVQI